MAVKLAGLLIVVPAQAGTALGYTPKVGAGETAVIDVRPLAACKRATLRGARCLPASDLLGPGRQIPGERDLLWLLGTLGLSGEEAVLVVGDTPDSRDFVGGLLYLAGQRQVFILDRSITSYLAVTATAAPGQERGLLRTAVFTQSMRDAAWLVHEKDPDTPGGPAITAPDAHTAIVRFARRVAAGDVTARVGWNLSSGRMLR